MRRLLYLAVVPVALCVVATLIVTDWLGITPRKPATAMDAGRYGGQ